MKNNKWMLTFLVLVAMFIITGAMLVILSIMLKNIEISNEALRWVISLIHIVPCFFGGYMIGTSRKEKQCQWGIYIVAIYFLVLFLELVLIYGIYGIDVQLLKTLIMSFILCAISGALGGITSAYNKNKRDM